MAVHKKQIRRSTLLTWLSVAVLIGLALPRLGWVPKPLAVWLVTTVTLLVIGWRLRIRPLLLLGIVGCGVALGSWRGTVVQQRLYGYDTLMQGSVLLRVQAAEDAAYGKNGQLTFAANHVVNVWTGQQLPGQIDVSGRGPNAIYQGDELLLSGKLRPGLGSYQGFASYAQLELVQHHNSLVLTLRRKFAAGMLSSLPEPLASFSMGLLIGQRASLPQDVKTDLQRVGLTHIIAVSGANLTIMLDASQRLLGKRSKRLSFSLSAALMLLFVAMTGGSASIIRAAWVSGLSMLAAYYGRRVKPLLLIAGVAAVTAYINPLYEWGDASWYLSFLAFFGVLVLLPLLQQRLPRLFTANLLLGIALESWCAEIMSVPYILFTFGQLSLVGIVANVLVVSAIPYAMLLGLVAGLAGMWFFQIAGWFAWPARLLLTYMLDTAHWLAHWPHVFMDGIWLSTPELIVVYALIALMAAVLGFKDRAKSAIITDNTSGAIGPAKERISS